MDPIALLLQFDHTPLARSRIYHNPSDVARRDTLPHIIMSKMRWVAWHESWPDSESFSDAQTRGTEQNRYPPASQLCLLMRSRPYRRNDERVRSDPYPLRVEIRDGAGPKFIELPCCQDVALLVYNPWIVRPRVRGPESRVFWCHSRRQGHERSRELYHPFLQCRPAYCLRRQADKRTGVLLLLPS